MSAKDKNIERIPLNPEELAKLLDKTTWGNDFSWDELINLGKFIQAFKVKMNTVLFSEGQLNQTMAILVEGTAEIFKSSANNQKKSIARVKSPQTFGEMSLIDGQPRSAEVQATSNCICLLLSKEKFLEMSDKQPKLAFKILWKISSLMSQRLRQVSGQLVDLV
ncbi:cyclic nucleotide-binding domain-containing protein [Litoribacillus peritrichatus]|uniref:Cyclic nucleotide-binding domain-containing protein n=1 Tax=Litoribacillus peritrichatus TaxID=718191 RepID=A0ABP7MXK3_9GAMM